MPNRGTQEVTNVPVKVDGTPDLRYKENEKPGTPVYDSRHRSPHPGGPPPQRMRHDRPMAEPGDAANEDGTLDMRFLENRIKAGIVTDPETERAEAARGEPDTPAHRRVGRSHKKH